MSIAAIAAAAAAAAADDDTKSVGQITTITGKNNGRKGKHCKKCGGKFISGAGWAKHVDKHPNEKDFIACEKGCELCV